MAISQIVQNSISPSVELGRPFILKPTITSPANAATDISDSELITGSPFLSLYGIAQANAEWEISTSPTFSFINVASTFAGSNTQFRVNASSGLVTSTTYYARVRYSDTSNNTSEYSDTVEFTTAANFDFSVEYLVIAGGGGAGGNSGAAGGAGGYRTNRTSSPSTPTPKLSGGGASIEANFIASYNTAYTVTVGAGGTTSVRGSNSVFSTISSLGGHSGGQTTPVAGTGGSGRGGAQSSPSPGSGVAGTPGQGSAGGNAGANAGGGGGGAGGAGGNGSPSPSNTGGAGGAGNYSDITGSDVQRGGGGGGGGFSGQGPAGPGGGGQGGNSSFDNATNGTALTGGGAGSIYSSPTTTTGGSGVVIIRLPAGVVAHFSNGVMARAYSLESNNVYEIQQTTTTNETVTFYPDSFLVEYLVVAGGGGGGGGNNSWAGGGGGAGGFRTTAGPSGGGTSAEDPIPVGQGIAYPIIVGAGGSGGSPGTVSGSPQDGSASAFGSIRAIGGGAGTGNRAPAVPYGRLGGSGGGGAGGDPIISASGGLGTINQGFNGGTITGASTGSRAGAGGGGAGAAGTNIPSNNFDTGDISGGAGGNGVASSISGTPVTYGGGGGGGAHKSGTVGSGGTGGGGNGAQAPTVGTAGSPNTGGGGGGGGSNTSAPASSAGGNGGSGIVIIKVPDPRTASFTDGVTFTSNTIISPGNTIYTITATSNTNQFVTFS